MWLPSLLVLGSAYGFILHNSKVLQWNPSGAFVMRPEVKDTRIRQSRDTRSNSYLYSVRIYDSSSTAGSLPKMKSRHSNSNADLRRQVDRVLLYCRESSRKSDGRENVVTIGLTEVNHAIVSAGRLGSVRDAVEIFRSIKSLNMKPDIMSYNNIIWSAGNAGDLKQAQDLAEELKQSGLRPNVYTYGSLMHACSKTKNPHMALKLLDRMKEEGVKPNQIVFTSAMEACGEGGKYKEALTVMDRMKEFGVRADLTMINAAIKACCIGGAMEEAEVLASSLREYGSMDLYTYHTLMMGHTKLSKHGRVLELYEEALLSSTRLDGGVYSLAMLSALNCGLFSTVSKIADRARREGVALTEAAYTILIQALSESGANDQAVECLATMEEEGLSPNVISYSAAITACRNRPETVLTLLQRMKTQGVTPNTMLLTTAINSLAKEGGNYTDVAAAILRDMETKGPEPNIYTYNSVTRAYAEAGRLEEAIGVLRNIRDRSLAPDRFTFTSLLIACGRTNNSDKVSVVMDVMMEAGVPLDSIVYGAAIDAHRRANNSLLAVQCLHDMYRHNIEPTAAHFNLVLRTLKAEGHIDKMFRMVVAISSKEDTKVNGNTFEIVMESLIEEGKWKEPLVLLRTMERLGFKASMNICVGLAEQLERARQYKAVLALYRVMTRYGYDFYENDILNGVFKRLVSITAKGVGASDLDNKVVESVGVGSKSSQDIDSEKNTLAEMASSIKASPTMKIERSPY